MVIAAGLGNFAFCVDMKMVAAGAFEGPQIASGDHEAEASDGEGQVRSEDLLTEHRHGVMELGQIIRAHQQADGGE